MAIVYDVDGNDLIEEVAKELAKKDNLKAPDWSGYIKTGPAKDRVPVRTDWWYVRAAAILRSFYRSKGPLGVQKLRIKYGSKKNRGHKPEKFYKSSGKIIRTIIQQLEKEELVKIAEVGVHKGRVIAPKGRSLLDKTASLVLGKKPKAPKVEEAPKKEEKPKEDKPKEEKKEKQPSEIPKKEKPKEAKKPEDKKEEKSEGQPSEAPKEPEKPKEVPKEKPKEEKPSEAPKEETRKE